MGHQVPKRTYSDSFPSFFFPFSRCRRHWDPFFFLLIRVVLPFSLFFFCGWPGSMRPPVLPFYCGDRNFMFLDSHDGCFGMVLVLLVIFPCPPQTFRESLSSPSSVFVLSFGPFVPNHLLTNTPPPSHFAHQSVFVIHPQYVPVRLTDLLTPPPLRDYCAKPSLPRSTGTVPRTTSLGHHCRS